jgi:hypothetical protein
MSDTVSDDTTETSSTDLSSDASSSSSTDLLTDSSSSSASDSSSTDGGVCTADDTSDAASTSDVGAASDVSTPVDYAKMVAIPSGINSGLTAASQSAMIDALGKPGDLTQDCSAITNAALKKLLVTQSVGPFKVTGLKPAVDALTNVFTAIKAQKPDLYAVITTAGMTCCRAVRGSTTNYSNHSWGTAIDLGINGVLTPLGSQTVQQGLVDAAPFFAAEQFFWGAGYQSRPDGMHFEASNELIASWKSSGALS